MVVRATGGITTGLAVVKRISGLLAQLGERMGHNHDVVGSSPAQTIK